MQDALNFWSSRPHLPSAHLVFYNGEQALCLMRVRQALCQPGQVLYQLSSSSNHQNYSGKIRKAEGEPLGLVWVQTLL